jgi:CubicO group peptidase (beta-lactamase class C family)
VPRIKQDVKHRRRFLSQVAGGLLAAMSAPSASRLSAVVDRRSQIDALMKQLHQQRRFNGEILVAEKGGVIYQGAFGLADPSAGRPYTTRTRSCLASLSKPITAVAVMMLGQQRRLAYDDPLSKYLPGFTEPVGAVTLRHLLTHTSGIPDYPQLDVDHPGVTNTQILDAIRKLTALSFPAGVKYQYSNSGYVLLALVIEAISGQSLPRFLDDRIFKPAGMSATFVLTSLGQKTADVARGYDSTGRADDFEGMETGDSGVYSTVGDLLRFDQALYTDTLVSQQTLSDAFVPPRVREGGTTYGFGWNIVTDASGVRVWHQGNTAGFRAFIERRLRDRITVIMLTNGGDTNRMAINDDIQRILRAESPGKPPPQ